MVGRIFISYSRRNKQQLLRLAKALEVRNRQTWVDLNDIPVSSEWEKKIQENIVDADAVVFLLTPDFVRSRFCLDELALAARHVKRLIPVLCEDLPDAEIPQQLAALQYVLMRPQDPFESGVDKLLEAVDRDPRWRDEHSQLLRLAQDWQNSAEQPQKLLRMRAWWRRLLQRKRGAVLSQDTALEVRGCPSRDLLLRGVELRRWEQWLVDASGREVDRPSQLHQTFVAASRAEAGRRQRRTFALLAGALAVTTLLSVATWAMRNLAIQSGEEAFAKGLAGVAEIALSQQSSQVEKSLLLAVEAMRRYPSLEGEYALRRSLQLLSLKVGAVNGSDEQKSDVPVHAVAVADDGRTIAFATAANEAVIFDVSRRVETARRGFRGEPLALHFRESTAYLVTAECTRFLAGDSTFRVYDLRQSQPVLTFEQRGAPKGVSLSGEGERAAFVTAPQSGSEGHLVEVRTISDGRVHLSRALRGEASATRQTIGTATPSVFASPSVISCTSDLRYLALSGSSRAEVWDLIKGVRLLETNSEHVILSLALNVGGKLLAYSRIGPDRSGNIVFLENSTEKSVRRIPFDAVVLALEFSPDGRFLAVSLDDETVRLWDVERQREVAVMPNLPHVGSIRFNAAGTHLVTGGGFLEIPGESRRGGSHQAVLWDITKCIMQHSQGHRAPVTALSFASDGLRVYTSSNDTTTSIWDYEKAPHIQRLSHPGHQVASHVVSPDGKYLLTSCNDRVVRAWDLGNSTPVLRWARTFTERSPSLALVAGGSQVAVSAAESPPQKHLAAGSAAESSPSVTLWNVDTGLPYTAIEHEAPVTQLVTSQSGEILATCTNEGKVAVWVGDFKRPRFTWNVEGDILDFKLDPQGQWVAAATLKREQSDEFRVWLGNTHTGKVEHLKHKSPVLSLAFSPSGDRIVAGTNGGSIVLRRILKSAPNGVIEQVFQSSSPVISLAFSPDGKQVVSGCRDHSARVWSLVNEKEVARVLHDLEVTHVAFSPDGRRIASASKDGGVKLWQWSASDLISEAEKRLNRNFTAREWEEYFPGQPYRKTFPSIPTAQ